MSPFLALGALILCGSGLALTLVGSPALDGAAGFLLAAGLISLAGSWVTRSPTLRRATDGYTSSAPNAPRHGGGA